MVTNSEVSVWLNEVDELADRFQKTCETHQGIFIAYTKLKLQENWIFNKYCVNKVRIQDCSPFEQVVIFLGPPPEDTDMEFLGALEETFSCSGLCYIPLSKYMFSNVNK